MGFKQSSIQKWSFSYAILKIYTKLLFKIYFRVKTHNKNNIPNNEIIVFATNHQNALIDALAIVASTKGQHVFLGRADIFQNKIICKLLTFIKMLPIYRIRDGKDKLRNNNSIFAKTIDVLKAKRGLVIMPEGNHDKYRRLRTLKKGISRIVFQAEEANDFKLNIKIVPVGLDYSNYSDFRSKLFINYGKPINVSDFYSIYSENNPKGMNLLREKLAEEIKKLMLNIESEKFYFMEYSLCKDYKNEIMPFLGIKKKSAYNNFLAEKTIISILNNLIDNDINKASKLNKLTSSYYSQLKETKLSNILFKKESFSITNLLLQSLLSIILFPLFIYGLLNNYLAFYIPILATKTTNDTQFISSIRFGVMLIAFPIFYFLQTFLLSFFITEPQFFIFYLFSLPLTGLFAFYYYNSLIKLISKCKFIYWKYTNNNIFQKLQAQHNKITQEIKSLFNKYYK